MSVEVFHDLATEFPSFISSLKEHIYDVYDDSLTQFTKESLERVPYFQEVGSEAIYDTMFTLTKRF